MIAEYGARIHQEKVEKSTCSTELEDTFENFIETLIINYENPIHMTAELKTEVKMAKTLLYTETVGTNLMSLNCTHCNQIQTKKIENPVEIRMTTKNSKATANYLVKAAIDIGNVKRVLCDFLLLQISSYNVVLRMPVMIKANVILRPGSDNATFGDRNTTIKCAAIGVPTAAAPITIFSEPADKQTQNTEITKLELLDTIRRTAKAAIDTLDNSEQEEAHPYVEEMLVTATNIFNQQLLNFQTEFPLVFTKEIPTNLPPLRPEMNHKITLKDSELSNYRNEYRPNPESKLTQLSKLLDNWKKNGIAVQASSPYSTPIFGVPKKALEEIRWVIDYKEPNKYTIRDYTPIPNQPIIRDHVASHSFRSKIKMLNAYYLVRVEPGDEIKKLNHSRKIWSLAN